MDSDRLIDMENFEIEIRRMPSTSIRIPSISDEVDESIFDELDIPYLTIDEVRSIRKKFKGKKFKLEDIAIECQKLRKLKMKKVLQEYLMDGRETDILSML